jgi:multiple sugar transport system substrate-binding protein
MFLLDFLLNAWDDHVHLNTTKQKEFEQKVGFNPGFPVSATGNQSTTLLGGWLLSIPSTSENKDLAWELITHVLHQKYLLHFISNMVYYQRKYP